MKNRLLKSGLSVLIAALLVLSGMLMPYNQADVFAAGEGTWDNPYTVAEAAAIQDNSTATVQGYIVGQPISAETVLTSDYPNDYALAIADTPEETDTAKMLYVQIASAFRPAFGMKTNPGNLGKLIKVTGNLTPYFTPHAGIKNITQVEEAGAAPVSVTGVSLNLTESSIEIGQSINLTAAVDPVNASNRNVIWSSDNEAAASVSEGVVTGIAVGTAVITVTTEEGGFTAACTVTVTEAGGSTGTWDNPYTVDQAIGIQDNRAATVQGYIVGQPTSNTSVLTSSFSGDTAVAIAAAPGESDNAKMLYVQLPITPPYLRAVFGLKTNPGKLGTLIKCTGNLTPYFTPHAGLKGTSAMEEIITDPIPVTGVSLDKAEASIFVGEAITLTATVEPGNATNKNVVWFTDNESVASVNNGIVTGIFAGTAAITVTTEDGGKTASCIVNVAELVDNAGPEISNLIPYNQENTGSNLRPVIGASYTDPSGIELSSIKLYLDDMDITAAAAVTESEISYIPEADLEQGDHTVRLVVSDKCIAANTSEMVWSFSVGELEYNLYFGQLHSHTNISDGQGTLDQAFSWARDEARADFFAVTDHSNWFDNDTKANINDGSASADWNQLLQKADEYNEPGSFVAIGGYEMTWSGSTGGWGHINTFNTPGFETRTNSRMDLKKYYETIAAQPQSISQLNHPGKTFGDFNDFGYYTSAADAVVQLIEVGNGEGAIGSSLYFPSYEYYTRALDKGWHLAPTNNQDNHMGNWVSANTARTVVLAPNLTRESVYDAIRRMRVYATEDSNLEIIYKANGRLMGSMLTNPESLDLEISINDPDSNDIIKNVAIISNGGQIVASKQFDGNTAEWSLTLEPNNSYYYVRVVQGDADIAVTAPVWTGDVTPVGISKVEVSQNPQLVGTPVQIYATVYNNGKTDLANIKVEFFLDTISEENKIGEGNIQSVAAAGSGVTKIGWTPMETGKVNIYARMILGIDGQDKVFTGSTAMEVVNPYDVVKVVVDGGHYNQYVTGDYKNKIETLKQMMTENGFMLVVNEDELTAADLENASILIITDPQSKDDSKYGLFKANFTETEISAVKTFAENGGALVITSRADYNDKGAEEAYESANQGNAILEAIGSSIRFNDDEVVDYTSNGGQEYRLYFDDYTSEKYGLTDDIPTGLTYSAYSGCSLLLKEGGDDTNVDWLVMGHDTTEILDSDLQNDAVPVTKGAVRSLGAEVLASGGKVIAAGSTFFSDFETAAGDNAYSNKMITEKILKWLTAPPEKTIAEVRADEDMDGKPDYLGKKFTVEGRVTAASKAAVNNTAFFDVMYVQDETGGITVFGVSTRAIPLGALVKITGTVDQYGGDIELQLSDENADIEVLDDSIVLIEPREMSTADSMSDINEGWLIETEGLVTAMTDSSLFINDGSGEARVFVDGYIGDDTDNPDMLGKWDKSIKEGDLINIVGLASEDADGHRIRVRNTAEIVKVKTPVTGISLDVTKAAITINDSLQLTATITPEDATYKNVIWSSSRPEVATVDGNGLVKPVNGGTAVITVVTEDGGFFAACEVIVTVPVTGITLNKQYLSLRPGAIEALKAEILPANATDARIIWTSDSEGIASVDENGTVTAHKIGLARITATAADGGFDASCIAAVSNNPATEVRINKQAIVIKVGKEEKLTALVGPGKADIKDVIWSSESPIIELIRKNDKVVNVRALAAGKAIVMVTALDGGFTAICEVTIIAK